MTALLVVMTFLAFILIDYFVAERREARELLAAKAVPERLPATAAVAAPPRMEPAMVGGFRVPENLRYHPGHTWALRESANLVRVGLDDFAARLLGKVERISLPQRGQWVRQGQKIVSLQRDGSKLEMVSPIEGAVTEINEAVLADPGLAQRDPYVEGWLLRVDSPEAKVSFRNLLGGSLARWWTEESATRLQRLMPGALGALAQDGGVALADLSSQLTDEQWKEIGREFFLS